LSDIICGKLVSYAVIGAAGILKTCSWTSTFARLRRNGNKTNSENILRKLEKYGGLKLYRISLKILITLQPHLTPAVESFRQTQLGNPNPQAYYVRCIQPGSWKWGIPDALAGSSFYPSAPQKASLREEGWHIPSLSICRGFLRLNRLTC